MSFHELHVCGLAEFHRFAMTLWGWWFSTVLEFPFTCLRASIFRLCCCVRLWCCPGSAVDHDRWRHFRFPRENVIHLLQWTWTIKLIYIGIINTLATQFFYTIVNPIFLNLPSYQLNPRQLPLNSTARATNKKPRFHHATHVLKSLHWLKIGNKPVPRKNPKSFVHCPICCCDPWFAIRCQTCRCRL